MTDREPMAVCIHEVAHAILYLVEGQPFVKIRLGKDPQVEIEPVELKGDHMLMTCRIRIDLAGHLAEVKAGFIKDQFAAREDADIRDSDEFAWNWKAHELGKWRAEHCYGPRPTEEQIAECKQVELSTGRESTKKKLDDNWSKILLLAEHLQALQADSMNYNEVSCSRRAARAEMSATAQAATLLPLAFAPAARNLLALRRRIGYLRRVAPSPPRVRTMPRLLTACSLTALLILPALLRADDPPKGDKDLEGTWEVVSVAGDSGEPEAPRIKC